MANAKSVFPPVDRGTYSVSAELLGPQDRKLFSARLKKLMGKDLQAQDLAKHIPCSAPTVHRWLNGQSLPSLPIAKRIVLFFPTSATIEKLAQGTYLEKVLHEEKATETLARTVSPTPKEGKTVGSNGKHVTEITPPHPSFANIQSLIEQGFKHMAAAAQHHKNANECLTQAGEAAKQLEALHNAKPLIVTKLEEKVSNFAKELAELATAKVQ